MPKIFCLDENTEETLAYLEEMRRSLWQEAVRTRKLPPNRRRVSPRIQNYFDFKTLEKISPTAALVLASIYDRRKHILGYKPHTVDEHLWKPQVISVLRSVGFHELLEMTPQVAEVDADQNVKVLKFLSAQRADSKLVGRMQEQLAQLLGQDEREQLLYAEPYGGMLEAALNSNMWAYPPEQVSDFPILKRWWMTGAIDTQEKTVTVAVYDQGVSIPGSLPQWQHYGLLQKALSTLGFSTEATPAPDSLHISFAMKISQTRTELPQHGKGLHTMLEVVQRAQSGRLRILSRKGDYLWQSGRDLTTRDFQNSVGGTLIEWQIQL